MDKLIFQKKLTLHAVLVLPPYSRNIVSVGILEPDKSNFKIRGKQVLKSLCYIGIK